MIREKSANSNFICCDFVLKNKITKLQLTKTLLFSLFFVIFLFSACESTGKIPEDTLVKVYADIVIAHDSVKTDSTNFNTINNEVFKRYNVTAQDYKESINYYNEDPLRWGRFFDKVILYVEDLKQKKSG